MVWPLDIDLDLTRIEVTIKEWMDIIGSVDGQPRADPNDILDGCRMLAYQVAAIEISKEPRQLRTLRG